MTQRRGGSASLQLHGAWAAPDPAFVYTIENMKHPLLRGDMEGFVRCAFAWILTAEFLNDEERSGPMMQGVLENPHPASIAGILGHPGRAAMVHRDDMAI